MPKLHRIIATVAEYEAVLKRPDVTADYKKQLAQALVDKRLEVALRQVMKPLPSGHRQPVARPEAAPTIVFFHVDVGTSHPFLRTRAEEKIDYAGALRASIAAAAKSNPESKIVVLTDATTAIPETVATIERLDVDRTRPTHGRLKGACELAKRVETPLVFLDTDVWLNQDARALVREDFDIGLTHRAPSHFTLMPINAGVMVATSPKAAEGFFGRCLALYAHISNLPAALQHYSQDQLNWYSDQLALAAFVDWTVPPECKQTRVIDGLAVRFLPNETYNYTVADTDTPASVAGKWALHFKGLRKQLMPKFA